MTYFDVFNGDADGLCALQQLRLSTPRDSVIVTGVKRDIDLLRRVDAQAGDEVTVLDISLDKNREPLQTLLDRGVHIEYFDHHFAGDIPQHANLQAHIDTAADVCSALLVDKHLNGAQRAWAVVGAFGDNFDDSARRAAEPLNLSEAEIDTLRTLGICLNYNGYGVSLDDLFFDPAQLATLIRPYAEPLAFVRDEPAYATLHDGYQDDMARADALTPESADEHHAVFVLPNEAWARRVSGVYGNALAQQYPSRAHALLTILADGSYRISVRAPLTNKSGADDLCRQFPTGGGRKAAAGINKLDASLYDKFVAAFRETYAG